MKTIEMDDLKSALDAGQVAGMYDSRGPGSFDALHIKGAKQLSVADTTETNLGDNKEAMLVFY